MKCTDFRALERATLRGFATLEMSSGMILVDCAYHRRDSGKAWVSPPGKPMLDADKKPIVGADGKLAYSAVISFVDSQTRSRWSNEGVEAIELFLAQSKEPAEAGSMNGGMSQGSAAGGRSGS